MSRTKITDDGRGCEEPVGGRAREVTLGHRGPGWSEAGDQGPGSTRDELVPGLRLQELRSLTSRRARGVQPKVSTERRLVSPQGPGKHPLSRTASIHQKGRSCGDTERTFSLGASPKPKGKYSGEPGRPYKAHSLKQELSCSAHHKESLVNPRSVKWSVTDQRPHQIVV